MGLGIGMLATIGAVAKVSQAATQAASSAAQKKALDLNQKQNTVQYQQRTLANYDLMQNVISHQVAQATAKGVGLDSASLEAIQRETLNVGAREQKNIDIEHQISKTNTEIEKRNVQRSLYSRLFGEASNLAFGAANFFENEPKKKSE